MENDNKIKRKGVPAVEEDRPKGTLEESLTGMGKELAEKANVFKGIENSLTFGFTKDTLETVRKYQETIAKVQKQVQPYAEIMIKVHKQWEKQRELIMPVIERMAEPIRIVQEAISKYPQIEKSFLDKDPVELPSSEIFSSRMIEDRLLDKIDNLEKKIQEFVEKEKAESKEPKISGRYLVYLTKDGVELKFNKENGNVQLGEVNGNIAPGTNEFKVFVCLLESSSYVAKYITLLQLLYPNKQFNQPLKFYQPDRWALTDALKKVKLALGFLPKDRAKNRDIIKSLPREKAYRLELKD